MQRLSRVLRTLALVASASVAVHELRFLIGFSGGDRGLVHVEHAYLSLGLSLVGALTVAALASFVRALLRARRTGQTEVAPRPPRFGAVWLAASITLVAVYSGQELLEGVLAQGHPGGVGGIVGHAGWVALLLAVAFGALIAWALRGAHEAIVRAARRGVRRRRHGSVPAVRAGRDARLGSDVPVLALNLAGRAPPRSFS